MSHTIYRDVQSLAPVIAEFKARTSTPLATRFAGICGFDGFVDTFVRLQSPPSMAEFGSKVAAAAGVAASYPVQHGGDKFGGNGPLLSAALNDIYTGQIDIAYIGALGEKEVLPIFQSALGAKTRRLYTLGRAAQTTCLEFTDGKVMLNDMSACAEITWERLCERIDPKALDQELKSAHFIAAVNWGKLPHAGEIWSQMASRLGQLGVAAKRVIYFMDLADFEIRPMADRTDLLGRLESITNQCHTLLSLNLREAWQLAEVFGGEFHGRKDADAVAEIAAYLKARVAVDRIIVHPNNGAACSSAAGTVFVPGAHCANPLISTGAGDNFGAGCLAAALRGLDDVGIVLSGNSAGGHFVRSGRSASFADMAQFLDDWSAGTLGERL